MDSEVLVRIAAEVMANRNLEPSYQATVDRYTRRAVNKVLSRCNREDVPERLETVLAEIVEAMLLADSKVPLADGEKDVASITRGDTAISYRDKGTALKNAEAFIKDFDADLVPFKKMRLPRDVHERG